MGVGAGLGVGVGVRVGVRVGVGVGMGVGITLLWDGAVGCLADGAGRCPCAALGCGVGVRVGVLAQLWGAMLALQVGGRGEYCAQW